MSTAKIRRVLGVGGSESAGVVGLGVDLRVFAAHGVHGCLAVSAVTAQPGGGCLGVGPGLLRAQVEAAGAVDAVKIGLLLSLPQATALVECLGSRGVPWVYDPVFQSSDGHALAQPSQWSLLTQRLLPHVALITPNLGEAAAMLGEEIPDTDQAVEAAGRAILDRGAAAVLMKGGHRGGAAVDILMSGDFVERFESERQPGQFRGTGCLLSSSIAALLARGRSLRDAVAEAKDFVDGALHAAAENDGSVPHVFFEYYGAEGLPTSPDYS
jgi:hydroxymethylpyrimidine/phosphomethylpyrimidine kinase